jgi:hypothetical protein
MLTGLINSIPERICAWVGMEGCHAELSSVDQVFDLNEEFRLLRPAFATQTTSSFVEVQLILGGLLQLILEKMLRESVGCFPWRPEVAIDLTKLKQSLNLVLPDKHQIESFISKENREGVSPTSTLRNRMHALLDKLIDAGFFNGSGLDVDFNFPFPISNRVGAGLANSFIDRRAG